MRSVKNEIQRGDINDTAGLIVTPSLMYVQLYTDFHAYRSHWCIISFYHALLRLPFLVMPREDFSLNLSIKVSISCTIQGYYNQQDTILSLPFIYVPIYKIVYKYILCRL